VKAPRKVDVATETAWTAPIQPDAKAEDLFQKEILSRGNPEPPAVQPSSSLIPLRNEARAKGVTGLYFVWEPDDRPTGHCGYDVYVTDMRNNEPLFKGHIDGRVFADKETTSIEVLAGKTIADVQGLRIKIMPDLSGGDIETVFGISAIGI